MSFFKKIFFAFTEKERIIFLAASGIAVISFCAVIGILVAQVTTTVPAAGGAYTEGTLASRNT